MAKSAPIILAAGGITFFNEWLHGQPNFRVPVATGAAALIFAGLEKIPGGEPAAVGIAVIMLIATLIGGVTPGIPSPAVQILDFINHKNQAKAKK